MITLFHDKSSTVPLTSNLVTIANMLFFTSFSQQLEKIQDKPFTIKCQTKLFPKLNIYPALRGLLHDFKT